jgi:hypothetical protein
MLARFVRLLILWFPILSYDYRHRRIRRRQICPACGNKVKVEIRFDPTTQQVICQCPIDLSCWGYNPVVRADVWSHQKKVEE